MRQRRIWTGIAVALLAVVTTLTGASAATASAAGVTANCGGYTVVSANYVYGLSAPYNEVGSIQLCKRPNNTYFGRLEMYNALPSGRFANGFLYYSTSTGQHFVSCDDNVGHVLPGGRICYTSSITNTSSVWNLYAVGRAYVSNGSGGWTKYAEGQTATVD